MPRFMLFIRGGDEETRTYTPEQYQQVLERYFAWAEQLRREGRHLGGEELQEEGRTVRRNGAEIVVDGPYVETKEAVGGYFMIEAAGEDEAAEVAKGCPVLGHGGLVEVRQIAEH